MKPKIIITGVSGFIGSNLAKYLSENYKIIGIDKVDWEEKGLPALEGREFYFQNINDPLPDIDDVYAVIHLAAKAGVRESMRKFDEYVYDNIIGTKSVLDKCVTSWKPKVLLVASSSSVHGDYDKGIHPKSPYAMTKVATEDLTESYKNCSLLDCDCHILRFFTVYGPGQRKGLAIRNFIEGILKDEAITVYGDGTQKRDFTYIDDICKAIDYLLSYEQGSYCIHEMGSNKSISINSVIYEIADILDKEIKIKYEDRNRYDVLNTLAPCVCVDNITKFKEGLEKQIEWQKQNLI